MCVQHQYTTQEGSCQAAETHKIPFPVCSMGRFLSSKLRIPPFRKEVVRLTPFYP